MVAAATSHDEDEFEFGDESDSKNLHVHQKRNGAHAPAKSTSTDSSVVFSPELLAMYYSRLFPYQLLYSWLSYDPATTKPGNVKSSLGSACTFPRREFSMTIEPQPGNEVYIRYQSFLTQEELTMAIQKRRPTKIDLGAVFNFPPKDNKSLPSGKLQTQERELVFDIDLTDYDDVRNCGCSGAKICNKCWKLMGMALKVMDEGLRKDFGFQHLAWFYSGRRGVHCWVCDESARKLTNEARSAVATYFEVNLGSEKNKNFNLSSPVHPSLVRAYQLLEPEFIKYILPVEGHKIMSNRNMWTKLLASLPEAAVSLAEKLDRKWQKEDSTPKEKWAELKKGLMSLIGKGGNSKVPKNLSNSERVKIEHWAIETVFRYTYPRLDINVSKMQNHLLKSPFCVHPKTGRVCVPIEAGEFESFDPFQVPTLAQLMKELDEYEANPDKDEDTQFDWQTSLKEPFENFQKCFLKPLLNDERRLLREQKEKQSAVIGDF